MTDHFHFESSIWVSEEHNRQIEAIDQRFLPFEAKIFNLKTVEDAYFAIREMVVRGAPLIGVTAAFGMYLALRNYRGDHPGRCLSEAAGYLNSSRPTAVNLFFATRRLLETFDPGKPHAANVENIYREAVRMRQEEIDSCRQIGEHGVPLIEEIFRRNGGKPVQILTHCNAGWLACVEWGTATAPIYLAHQKGIPLHVWVDETRPRNQGARLTAFELGLKGVPHTVIPDNAGGHLMQHGLVDLVVTGSDRTTLNGDVANKIGTYLKALAAADNGIPFYVALPSSSIDWELEDGVRNIPVEERSPDEVAFIEGWDGKQISAVRLIPEKSPVANYGFDVTPARLVTGLITERGVCRAEKNSLLHLFPEKQNPL